MAKQNKPAIRFNGFTDAWEQRKLGELLKTITTGKSVNSDDGAVAVGDIGILKTSCVSYDRFNPYESKPVVKDELQSVKCAVEKDSVIVSRMNTPERVGACGYVSTDFPNLFLPDRLWKLKFQDNVDAYFVYMMLVSSVYKAKITSMASGTSGSMYNIPKETFLNLQLVVPVQTSEQRKIGQVLRQLNDLITLHQRKYDKLQVLKKAMLEKMFPKNGSSVPEIRFKGFTDAWEQRKLIDLLDQPITDGPHETPNIVDDGIPFISADAIVDNKIDFTRKRGNITEEYDLQCRKKYKPEVHDVYLVKSGSTVGKVAIVETTQRFNIWSPLAAMRCKKNSNPYFLFALLQTKENQAQVKDKASNGTQPNLSMRALEQFDIVSPYSRNEQIKIGEFFNSLDHLITLHQRELEKLQNIKKSMLEKMFV